MTITPATIRLKNQKSTSVTITAATTIQETENYICDFELSLCILVYKRHITLDSPFVIHIKISNKENLPFTFRYQAITLA